MSRSVDCNLSHSLAETASSVTTMNQVDDPIIVTVAHAGAVASCIPSLQGLQVRSLWDTGATLCLVDRLMSHRLVLRGAIQKDLVRPVVIDGVGEGCLHGQSSITVTIRFNDGKARQLQAVVVERLICELIIGLDFMQDEHILFEPQPGDSSFEMEIWLDIPRFMTARTLPLLMMQCRQRRAKQS